MATPHSFSDIQTLIVDDMEIQRSTLRGQLRQLNINYVDQATTAEEAVRLCKLKDFGLVLCDYNLNQKTDGQQLLEYLRDTGLLNPTCLFFMVTAENSYLSVISTSEHRPDAYLLKPINAGDVSDRLQMLLARREALYAINHCLANDNKAGALTECDKVIENKGRWTMQALQLKGQTLLQMGHHQEARQVFLDTLEIRQGLVWAQLGLAKALKAGGALEEAHYMAQNIINSKDGEKNIEAYDLVAACLEEKGDSHGAHLVMKDSARVMPSARRQRLVGESAYLNGDMETAKECFARLAKSTRGAITASPQDLLVQAQLMVDTGEPAEAVKLLKSAAQQYKSDVQFTAVSAAITAQAHMNSGNTERALEDLIKAREGLRRVKADFATVSLAKAEIMTGHEEAGIQLLEKAISSDHENTKIKQLIGNALKHTGHEDKFEKMMDEAVGAVKARVDNAKSLFRNNQIDEALKVIDEALREYPENTAVLLQAAQMNCMSLRLKKQMNAAVIDRIRLCMLKLDDLMPGSDRVAKMNLYYRDTVSNLRRQPDTRTA
jgi:tetratricopeptide (TPR) repeat protein